MLHFYAKLSRKKERPPKGGLTQSNRVLRSSALPENRYAVLQTKSLPKGDLSFVRVACAAPPTRGRRKTGRANTRLCVMRLWVKRAMMRKTSAIC